VRRLPSDFFSDKAIFRRNPDGFQEKSTQSEGKDGSKMCAGIDSAFPKTKPATIRHIMMSERGGFAIYARKNAPFGAFQPLAVRENRRRKAYWLSCQNRVPQISSRFCRNWATRQMMEEPKC
jgi:hypothetical protein